MTADFNVGIVAGERQLQRIFVPADRANSVPHADEPRLANPRCKGAFEVVSEIEIAFFFGAAMTPLAVDCMNPHQQSNGVRHERIVAARNEPVHAQQRCNRAGRVGAAAEPEQEDPITFLKVIH
jgi:hypothetical protein